MMRKRTLLSLCVAAIASLTGCPNGQTTKTPNAQSAKEKVAALAAGQPADEPTTTTDPSSPFTHEIDLIAEGKRFREATTALDRGDAQKVEGIRQELAASPKYHALADALQGLILVKQGKLEEAIRIAEEISAIPVMQPEAYVIAGEVFQKQNRLSEALAAFQNAVEINPQHIRANRWLGIIYYDTGSMKLAIHHLRMVAGLDPAETNSLLLSGKINQEYEQYEEAVRDYQTVAQRKLDDGLKIFVSVKLAECLVALRKLDEARKLLATCPTTPAVVATQATIAESEGQFDEAITKAKDALAHSPNQRTATLVLGRIYVTQKQWQAGIDVLEPVVKAAPYDHETRLLLGRALVGSGDKERGQQEVTRATELKDDLLKFANLHQDAMSRPDDAQVRFQLGQMAEKLGRFELAQSWYRAALGLDEKMEGAKVALETLQGRNKGAKNNN